MIRDEPPRIVVRAQDALIFLLSGCLIFGALAVIFLGGAAIMFAIGSLL